MKSLNLRLARFQFFDRKVIRKVKDDGLKVLSRFGAYVRTTARQSLKPAKRKSEGELTPHERESLQQRFRLWAVGRISEKPKLPRRPSRPGQPPAVWSRESLLRWILFAYDRREQSVVIGPHVSRKSNGSVPELLEHGGSVRGARIAARPFMEPAFEKNLPHLRNWYRPA